MKIRIKDNSIRYRLTRSEVEQLASKGSVTAHTEFGSGHPVFTYRIVSEQIDTIHAGFDASGISVAVPKQIVANWAATDQVGFSYEQESGDGAVLKVLIEKDFTCLKVRQGEDESDHYPNPLAEENA